MSAMASFYLPLALAFAILQAITRRIYLSFGDFAMFASFAAVYACFDAILPVTHDLAAGTFALVLALLCGASLGYAIARLVLGERLLQAPLAYMIASIGIGIALQESHAPAVTEPRCLGAAAVFRRGAVSLRGVLPIKLSVMTGWAISSLWRYRRRSRFAVAQRFVCTGSLCPSPKLAMLTGIDAAQVVCWSFALSGALAGVTGWTAAISYGGANFSIGLMTGFKAMFASVIGGFGTLRGAVAGAILLAVIEVGWSSLFSTAYRDVAVFSFIVLVLVFRPQGLMARISKEKAKRHEAACACAGDADDHGLRRGGTVRRIISRSSVAGLTFNYRYSEATMVVVGKQMTPLPEGARVEALFDSRRHEPRNSVPTVIPASSHTSWKAVRSTASARACRWSSPCALWMERGVNWDRDETTYQSDVDQTRCHRNAGPAGQTQLCAATGKLVRLIQATRRFRRPSP